MHQLENLTNEGMLEAMYLDRVIHRLSLRDYPNRQYMSEENIWRRWLV